VIETLPIEGSDQVLVPFMADLYVRGTRRNIVVVKESKDSEQLPDFARKALVGLRVSTILNSEEWNANPTCDPLPPESLVAYLVEVIEALRAAEKTEAADFFRDIFEKGDDLYQMCIFFTEEYEVVE
jgi:hypothetical protein